MAATKSLGTMTLPAFRGLRNDRPLDQFDAADLAVAINVDISEKGIASRRRGYVESFAAAGAHSLWTDGSTCLFAQSYMLKLMRPDYSGATVLASDLTIDRPVVYQKAADRIYWTNGEQSGVVENGENRSWGLVPPPAPAANTTGGELPPGRYGFTATYVAIDGQESGAPPANLIDLPDGGGIALFLTPSDDPRVAAQRVYLTTANGDQPYLAGTFPASATTATISLNTIELQIPLQTMLFGPCPHGTLLGHYRGRMYVAKEQFVFYSAPFGLELFKATNYLAFPTHVRLIAPVQDGIYFSDDERVYWASGATPDTLSMIPLADRRPAIRGMPAFAPMSEIFGDGSTETVCALWLGEEGPIAGLPGGQARLLTDSYRFNAPAAVAQSLIRRSTRPLQYLASFLGG